MCCATHPDTGLSDVSIHRMCIQSKDELSIAGALHRRPVELVKRVSVNEHAIAHAEYVIEGEILPGKVVILPSMLTYYNGPRSLADCTRHAVDRILSQFDLDGGSYQWEGMEK